MMILRQSPDFLRFSHSRAEDTTLQALSVTTICRQHPPKIDLQVSKRDLWVREDCVLSKEHPPKTMLSTLRSTSANGRERAPGSRFPKLPSRLIRKPTVRHQIQKGLVERLGCFGISETRKYRRCPSCFGESESFDNTRCKSG